MMLDNRIVATVQQFLIHRKWKFHIIQPNACERILSHLPKLTIWQAGKRKKLYLNSIVHFFLYTVYSLFYTYINTCTYIHTYVFYIYTQTKVYRDMNIYCVLCVCAHICVCLYFYFLGRSYFVFWGVSVKTQIYIDRQSSTFWTLTLNYKMVHYFSHMSSSLVFSLLTSHPCALILSFLLTILNG